MKILPRFGPYFSIAYTKDQYLLIGLTPESYHRQVGTAWLKLEKFERAIEHFSAASDNANSRYDYVTLGYCYACLNRWAESAKAYRLGVGDWDDPITALALAEAEFRSGNTEESKKILALVDIKHAPLSLGVRRRWHKDEFNPANPRILPLWKHHIPLQPWQQ